MGNQRLYYAVMAVVTTVLLYVRWRYLDMPLERDEGEYAYGAQLLLHGEGLYNNLYSLKWPGIFLSYSFILLLFGQSAWAIHFGVLLMNLATGWVIYRLGRYVVDRVPACLAALTFLLFTIQREVQGIVANSEHFVIFFICLSLWALLHFRATSKDRYLIISGLLAGLALLTKQHAIGLVLGMTIYLLLDQWSSALKWRSLFYFGGAVAMPVVLAGLVIFVADDFDRFWFQTVTYARAYVGLTGAEEAMAELGKRIKENLLSNPLLWLGFGASLVVAIKKPVWPLKLAIPLVLGSFLAMSFGWYFRPHYVLLITPVAALMMAGLYQWLWSRGAPLLALGLVVLGTGSYFVIEREYLFQWDANWTNYRLFYREPFRETRVVGDLLSDSLQPTDQVLVIGSEPQVNFYTKRRSVTGYIYTYPFFESHQYANAMYEEWKAEVNQSRPEFIVLMGHWKTYGGRDHPRFKPLWEFAENFIRDNQYSFVGEVALPYQNGGHSWGPAASLGDTGADQWIRVYAKGQ